MITIESSEIPGLEEAIEFSMVLVGQHISKNPDGHWEQRFGRRHYEALRALFDRLEGSQTETGEDQ